MILDDLGFFDEPFFQDGPVAQAVAAAVAAGVSFHSAAGNDADEHYAATFRGNDLHDFSGTGDTFDDIIVGPGDTLDCVLQWNDPFGASANDYDLEFYDMSSFLSRRTSVRVSRRSTDLSRAQASEPPQLKTRVPTSLLLRRTRNGSKEF